MTDKLRKAAQDVLGKYDSFRETSCNETYSNDMEALREALQADGIGDAVQESHMQDEPSIDALIAEIEALPIEHIFTNDVRINLKGFVAKNDIKTILDKYRRAK